MNARQLIVATAIVISTSGSGVGIVSAAPLDPSPPCPNCGGQPASPTPPLKAANCWPYGRVGPGSARGGGGVPVYPPPCPPGTPH